MTGLCYGQAVAGCKMISIVRGRAGRTGQGEESLVIHNPFRQQIAVVTDKPGLAVQAVRMSVRPCDFEMESADTERTAYAFGEGEGAPSNASSPMTGAEVDFVEESVAPAVFQAVAERQDEVANGLTAVADQPDSAQRRII